MEDKGYVVRDRERELDKISEIGVRVKKKVKKHAFKLELHTLVFKGISSLSIKTFFVCIEKENELDNSKV